MRVLACYIFCQFIFSSIQAKDYIDSLKYVLQKESSDTGRFEALLKLGSFYSVFYTQPDSIVGYVKDALYLAKKLNDTSRVVRSLEAFGSINNYYNNYPQALDLAFQSLELAKLTNDTHLLCLANHLLVRIYLNMSDYKKALEQSRILGQLNQSGYFKDMSWKDYWNIVSNLDIGRAYQGLAMPDSALYHLQLTYQFAKVKKGAQPMCLALENLGKLYKSINKPDSALIFYKDAMTYALPANRKDLWAEINLSIAELFNEIGKTDSSFYFARRSQEYSIGIKYDKATMRADSLLAVLYEGRHIYDSAYTYLEKFYELKQKIFNNQKAVQIQNIYFNETLRRQRLEQEAIDKQKAQETNRKLYSLLAGLAFISALAFILYRANKQKQKRNKQLDKAFNELKSTQAQLIQSEKMASLGELTAGIAHEIQNPLNFVNNFSEVNSELIEELEDERRKAEGERDETLEDEIINDIKQNLGKINHHGKRADAIVKGMLEHSKTSSGVKEPTDINKLCDEYLRLAYHGLRAKDKSFNAHFKTDFDDTIEKINIVPQDMGRVFLNIINNAFYAVSSPNPLKGEQWKPLVSVSTRKIAPLQGMGAKVEIKITDNGNGIPQNIIDKIFQPFFTTKPTGQGTGLGLSLSYDIVKAHGGEINVKTMEREGTEFIIQLPV